MSDELCSADLETLQAYVDKSRISREALADDIEAVNASWDRALANSEFRDVEGNPGPALKSTMEEIEKNEQWIQVIVDTLRDAPVQDGVSAMPADDLSERVQQSGAAPSSKPVEYEPLEIVGEPVTSGLVNDPINAATGNFVHADRDLRFAGFAAQLDVVRTYNSMAFERHGIFGRGWSSLLDMSITADQAGEVARLRFTDGAEIVFHADEQGAWRPNLRRRLRLESTDVGWTLSRHNGRRIWYFDAEGRLVGGEEGTAAYGVTYSHDKITLNETQSGRSVRYDLDDGLVTLIESSDGRVCRYRYANRHCVAAERAIGDVSYEIADNLVVAIFDADAVMQCRNTYNENGKVLGQLSSHGRQTAFVYDDNGATRITDDSNGSTNVLFHDARGNLVSMIGGNGAAMRASFDRHDRITKHVDREGGETRYEYHPNNDLDLISRKIDPDGLFEERDYDAQGRMVRQVDRACSVFTYDYNDDNVAPTRISGPEGVVVDTLFDDRGLPIRIIDGDGVETAFAWDADGQLVRHTNGAGESTTFSYDPTGELVEIRDPLGRAATFDLDDTGRVRTVTDVDGYTSTVDYSPAGRITAIANEKPGSFSATYDGFGNLDVFTDQTGATVRFGHDHSGYLTEIVGPDGAVTAQEFDAMGQLAAIVDPAGNRALTTYDREGRSISVTDYHGRTYRREVDALGRTTSMIGPDGGGHQRTYHPNGQVASITDALGRRFTFEVDDLGRLIAEVDPDGGRRAFEYSVASRLIRQVTPAGREYRYTYDDAGRLATVVDPDGAIFTIDNNDQSRIAAEVFDEQTSNFRFDEAGRVVGWSGPDDGPGRLGDDSAGFTDRLELSPYSMLAGRGDDDPAQFGYDVRGLLETVTDPAGVTTTFARDIRGRLIGRMTGEQSTDVEYDASGAVARLRDSAGQTATFTNTPAGELQSFVLDGTDIGRSFSYTPSGQVATIGGLSGDPTVRFTYDPLGQLDAAATSDRTIEIERDLYGHIASTRGSASPASDYQRDADGMLVRRVEADGHETQFERSAAGRLLGFVDSEAGAVPLPEPSAVDRDRAGRITVDSHGRAYAYDQAGRLIEAVTERGRQHFTYNDLGLLATDGDDTDRRTFTYDVGGRLVTLTDGERSTTYRYDDGGRREFETHSDGSEVHFFWDDLGRLVRVDRTDAAGQTVTRRVTFSGLGRPELVDDIAIGWDDGFVFKPVRIGDRRYLRSGMSTRLAEPGAEWNDGTFDDAWGYDSTMLDGVNLGYRGELTVDGLVFMGDRVYDPATRAWLSHDPVGPPPGANGSFVSPYNYSWCDPINYLDPSGREPITVDEFDAWKKKQETNRFERAIQAFIDDPWGTLAMVAIVAAGVVMVATGVGAGIGAGILIGAAATFAVGLATDNVNPRSIAIGAAFGAVTGGGIGGAVAAGVGESVTSQVLVDGKGFGDIDWGAAAIGGATGGAFAGAAKGVGKGYAAAKGAGKGPAGDVAPLPAVPRSSADAAPTSPVPRIEYPDGVPAGTTLNQNAAGDSMFTHAAKRQDKDANGQYDVVAHGTPDGVQVKRPDGTTETVNDPGVLSETMGRDGWNGTDPIRLMSCNTGRKANGFAQRLADHTRVPVTAPTKPVFFDSIGRHSVHDVNWQINTGFDGRPVTTARKGAPGEWRTFHPRPEHAPPPVLAPAAAAPVAPPAPAAPAVDIGPAPVLEPAGGGSWTPGSTPGKRRRLD
jgi:RHS repeat-associated protein